MLPAVRCFTCGKVLGNLAEKFHQLVVQKVPMEEIFRILNLKRYCCTTVMMTQVEIMDDLLKYEQLPRQSSE